MWALLLPVLLNAQTRHDLLTGRELGFVGVGLGLHGTAWAVSSRPWDRPLQLDPASVPPIDRIALDRWDMDAHRASNLLFVLAAGGSLTVGALNQHGQDPFLPAAISLESLLLTSGLTNTVKELVRRPRPYAYGDLAPADLRASDEAYVSFWSGHTANTAALTFSTAVMVQRSDASPALKTGTWIGAAVLPAVMGVMRVKAGRHFPTDVFTGYLVGAGVGILVPYFHRAEKGAPAH